VKGVNALAVSMALVDADARTQRTGRSTFRARRADTADLKLIHLFGHVAESNLKQLADRSRHQCLRPLSLFIEENEQCDSLHAVLEGTIEILSGSDEQETVIDIAQPSAVLLLGSVMTGFPYAASARTLSHARIIAMPAAAIRALFDRDQAFARAVAVELSRASCRMIEELRSLKTRTSEQRLLDWMLHANAQSGGGGQFKLPFGKRTLAALLGMTPENLSRNLHRLAKRGVTVRGRDVTFTDRPALIGAFGWDEGSAVAR
jgi:CRP/FNR family transcriptional activator FtrB